MCNDTFRVIAIQIILKGLQNLEKQRQIFRSSDQAELQKTKPKWPKRKLHGSNDPRESGSKTMRCTVSLEAASQPEELRKETGWGPGKGCVLPEEWAGPRPATCPGGRVHTPKSGWHTGSPAAQHCLLLPVCTQRGNQRKGNQLRAPTHSWGCVLSLWACARRHAQTYFKGGGPMFTFLWELQEGCLLPRVHQIRSPLKMHTNSWAHTLGRGHGHHRILLRLWNLERPISM